MQMGINLSGTSSTVYSLASLQTVVGTLYNGENFVYTGNYNSTYDSWQVYFINSSGGWSLGWYKGKNGFSFWKNKSYIKYAAETDYGTLYGFYVTGTTTLYSAGKVALKTLNPGYMVASSNQSAECGSTEKDWLYCTHVRLGGQGTMWYSIYHLFIGTQHEGTSYGYADTKFAHSSTAPVIEGSW